MGSKHRGSGPFSDNCLIPEGSHTLRSGLGFEWRICKLVDVQKSHPDISVLGHFILCVLSIKQKVIYKVSLVVQARIVLKLWDHTEEMEEEGREGL